MKTRYFILILYLLMGSSCYSSAHASQKKISVYVSTTNEVLSDNYKDFIEGELLSAFSKNVDEYIPVNRSKELNSLLEKAHIFLKNGHIDYDQIPNATIQWGEDQLCAVSVIKLDYTYVFRAFILDVKNNTVIKSASSNFSNDPSFSKVKTACDQLASELLSKKEEPQVQNTESKKNGTHSNIAWGIAGTGYPWNLISSIEWRWGGNVGFGLYGDIGMDFTYYSSSETLTSFKYAGGIKFYPYKGLFLDCGYGSICPASVEYKSQYKSSHGVLFHAGYNLFLPPKDSKTGFFLGLCGGASYDVINKIYAPSIYLKIGISWIL